MASSLDPLAVYDKGLASLDSLAGPERLVFMLQDFDILMEMEGWDHFYLYDHHFAWYSEMKDWLRTIGATSSLAILDDYESHVRILGFEVSPAGIEALLHSRDETYFDGCPDWSDQYCALREDRWAKATTLLRRQGVVLQSADPETQSDGTDT